MSSLWYRVTDAIDCAITDAVHSNAAQREAKANAKKMKLGKTYYTITKTNQPWAESPELLEEHVFTRMSFATGLPEGAAALWLQAGPVYSDRRSGPCEGLMTMREYTAWVNGADGPNIGGRPDKRRSA